MFLARDRIKAVTEADVLRVAKAYLKESNRTLASFIPDQIPGPRRDSGHAGHRRDAQGFQGRRRGRRR